jgi:poly(3-hydroxybutyrate) depolymerase
MEIATGFSALADQAGFAVVYPDGLLESNGGQTNWAYFFNDFNDDVRFFRQLISAVQASVGPDPKRIYVTGLLSGALMSYRLGVQLSDLMAGIGVVEGALFYGSPRPVPPAVGPVSVLILHGDLDTTIPYCGTPSDASQEQSFNYWTGTSADSCSSFDTPVALCDGQGNISAVTGANGLYPAELPYEKNNRPVSFPQGVILKTVPPSPLIPALRSAPALP